MKNISFFLFVFLLFSISLKGQNSECNKSVWINRFTNLIPKEVCIPNGNFHITEVYEDSDINGDGLNDFIFDWNKYPLKDGDTIYVTIYIQNPDSSFSHFKTFINLYPVYFKNYSLDYIPEDEKLLKIHHKYNDEYPLIRINFIKDTIQIVMKEDAEANLIITYKFDKTLNTWIYDKGEEYFLIGGGYKSIDLLNELGPTIDSFSFFIGD